jgi:hypothetical protein
LMVDMPASRRNAMALCVSTIERPVRMEKKREGGFPAHDQVKAVVGCTAAAARLKLLSTDGLGHSPQPIK